MGFIASYKTVKLEMEKPRNRFYDVDITQFVQPEVVYRRCGEHKITISESGINLLSSDVQFVQNPLLDETLISSGLYDER
jgi:hypothetical protein